MEKSISPHSVINKFNNYIVLFVTIFYGSILLAFWPNQPNEHAATAQPEVHPAEVQWRTSSPKKNIPSSPINKGIQPQVPVDSY